MQKLPQFKGHFFNWYGTQDLHPLNPAYFSSVDSGNLAGHLIVRANACEEWMETATAPHARLGMMDHLQLACDAIEILPAASSKRGRQLASILEEIEAQLNGAQAIETLSPDRKSTRLNSSH